MWISLCFIDSFATFECSNLKKRLDCSNDCVRFPLVCAYDNSSLFKTNVIIGINHLWIDSIVSFAFTPDFTCGMCMHISSNDLILWGIHEGTRKCNTCEFLSVSLIILQRVTFKSSILNKRLDCSNDCARAHLVCLYDKS